MWRERPCGQGLSPKGITGDTLQLPPEEQMDCSFGRHKGPWRNNKPVAEGKIWGTIIPTVVDTGCSQTMVWADLISPQMGSPETTVSMIYIHGLSYTYERRQVILTVMGQTAELAVGLSTTLPCSMLLGIDWPYL